jgi:hypothetical protein
LSNRICSRGSMAGVDECRASAACVSMTRPRPDRISANVQTWCPTPDSSVRGEICLAWWTLWKSSNFFFCPAYI